LDYNKARNDGDSDDIHWIVDYMQIICILLQTTMLAPNHSDQMLFQMPNR